MSFMQTKWILSFDIESVCIITKPYSKDFASKDITLPMHATCYSPNRC